MIYEAVEQTNPRKGSRRGHPYWVGVPYNIMSAIIMFCSTRAKGTFKTQLKEHFGGFSGVVAQGEQPSIYPTSIVHFRLGKEIVNRLKMWAQQELLKEART